MVMAGTVSSSSPTSSLAKNDRKSKKPMMEKKRRARINTCLNQLKSLVLQASKRDSSQFNKLEKADILELTVNHMQNLQRQRACGGIPPDAHVLSKYRDGFTECAKEVFRYIDSVSVNREVKDRLVGHLSGCLQAVNPVAGVGHMESVPQQHTATPLPLPFAPQQALVAGLLVHPSPTPQFQTGLNFVLPPLAESSVPSFVAPASALPLSHQPIQTTPPSAAVVPNKSSAFHEVSSSGRGAGHEDGVPSSPSSSTSSSTLTGSVDVVSEMPHYSFASPIQVQGSVAHVDEPSAATVEKSSALEAAPSTEESSSLSLKSGPAWLPLDLKQTPKKQADSSVPSSSSSSSSSSDLIEKMWRPW